MGERIIFIGTQGEGEGQGIWRATFDPERGLAGPPVLAARVDRPTWLHRHPSLPVLYAVSEVGNRDGRDGRIHAFSTGAAGELVPLADVSAHGGGPTDLATSADGTMLFAANFGGGQASAFALAPDGSFTGVVSQCMHEGTGPHPRQTKPHPHGVTCDPSGRFLLAPDMGADKLYVHAIDAAAGTIRPHGEHPLPRGSGSRLARFSPDGRFVYLLSELSAELFVFAWEPQGGSLSELQRLPLDPPWSPGDASAAAIVLSADGLTLYASNRRTHAIHAYSVSREDGLLEAVQEVPSGGERPWSATLSPDEAWLLVGNQASDRVSLFARSPRDGRLEARAGGDLHVPSPTCVVFA